MFRGGKLFLFFSMRYVKFISDAVYALDVIRDFGM